MTDDRTPENRESGCYRSGHVKCFQWKHSQTLGNAAELFPLETPSPRIHRGCPGIGQRFDLPQHFGVTCLRRLNVLGGEWIVGA